MSVIDVVGDAALDVASLIKYKAKSPKGSLSSYSARELYESELETTTQTALDGTLAQFKWFTFSATPLSENASVADFLVSQLGSSTSIATLGISAGKLDLSEREVERLAKDLNDAIGGNNFSNDGQALVARVQSPQSTTFVARLERNAAELQEKCHTFGL